MRSAIQIRLETEAGQQVQQIASWERIEDRLVDISLTLAESKSLLAAVQKILVEQQVAEYLEARRGCPHCGKPGGQNGSHSVSLQTLFGNIEINSPRWRH
jgi:hypothetical protein